jgi:nicotinamide mononucleotide transporter
MNAFEAVGVVAGALGVWLTTRQSIWCWPVGLVSVSAFIVVFGQARLYANMGLQAVYVIACLYGWYAWLHGGRDHDGLRVTRMPPGRKLAAGLLGTGFAVVLGLTLHNHTNAALPFLDSFLTAFSLVAQWLQTRKWIEAWLVWVAVDVLYVGMYILQGLLPTAGLYAVFLILAALGWRAWRASMGAKA